MFSAFSDFAPIMILLTLVLSLIIGRHITRQNLRGFSGFFAILGFIFGLIMTFMNLVYTSKELFLLSPVIALGCILYLRYRDELEIPSYSSLLRISSRNNTILSIVWWILLILALLVYYFSEIYTRHPLFFVFVSGAVALLSVQIISYNGLNKLKSAIFIVKIFLLSLTLRYSAYFVSPYPIGSDPWVHREYISFFVDLGHVAVPPDFLDYYVYYPISHLYAACTVLLGSISPHDAMFLLGVVLTLSTIVTFLIVRMLTGNVQIALISMLLLNFTDVLIQWSVQIIAMSYGIAIYAFIIFFALRMYSRPDDKNKYALLLLVFLCIIVWTHTISAFITLVSLFALAVGYILYEVIYNRNLFSIQWRTTQLLLLPFVFLTIVMIYHWMDPSYPFFDKTFGGLIRSLSIEAEFLGATSLSNVSGRWEELLQPIGFCMYVFFGIIGTLYCCADKARARKYFPLIFLALVLFFVRYAFPIFGMRNIIPDRWPAFAFVCFALFIVLGIYLCIHLLKSKKTMLCTIAILFFMGSFFMITNEAANQDSPLYGEEASVTLVWTESEMNMYAHISGVSDRVIIADSQTWSRPFRKYLKHERSAPYRILPNGTVNKELLSSSLVTWREISLTRPMGIKDDHYVTNVLLGDHFWNYLNKNYCCIWDTYSARTYLYNS